MATLRATPVGLPRERADAGSTSWVEIGVDGKRLSSSTFAVGARPRGASEIEAVDRDQGSAASGPGRPVAEPDTSWTSSTTRHARVGVEMGALRGFDVDDESYFDRLDEQVNHLLASIDAAANAMGMLLDLQLNERAYVVSVVATIFVPLTFLTGFFGMNFGWMVDQIDGQIAFWLLGVLPPIAAGVVSWRLLVRRFLIGDDGQPRRH